MGRFEIHQTDGTAPAIYTAARRMGFSVTIINRPVDALFGIYDQTIAVEIKTASGKLEPSQATFFRTFKGMRALLKTPGDVVHLYREMRRRHDLIFGDSDTDKGVQRDGEKEERQGRQTRQTDRQAKQEERRNRRRHNAEEAEATAAAAGADRGRAHRPAR